MAQPETMPYGYGRDQLTEEGLLRWVHHWATAIQQMNAAIPLPYRELTGQSEMTDYLRKDASVKIRQAVDLLREAAFDKKDTFDIHARWATPPWERK